MERELHNRISRIKSNMSCMASKNATIEIKRIRQTKKPNHMRIVIGLCTRDKCNRWIFFSLSPIEFGMRWSESKWHEIACIARMRRESISFWLCSFLSHSLHRYIEINQHINQASGKLKKKNRQTGWENVSSVHWHSHDISMKHDDFNLCWQFGCTMRNHTNNFYSATKHHFTFESRKKKTEEKFRQIDCIEISYCGCQLQRFDEIEMCCWLKFSCEN